MTRCGIGSSFCLLALCTGPRSYQFLFQLYWPESFREQKKALDFAESTEKSRCLIAFLMNKFQSPFSQSSLLKNDEYKRISTFANSFSC